MDYSRCIKPCVESEIGKLNYVLLHAPGPEIEHMTPENAHRFLFSDILNQREAYNDYKDFQGTLRKVTNVLTVRELLEGILEKQEIRNELIESICKREKLEFLIPELGNLSNTDLAKAFIEGLENDNFKEKYIMPPAPNFFFMRDASFTMYDNIMISKMATTVRDRESAILQAIYNNSPIFDVETVNPVEKYAPNAIGRVEGGDVLIARHDIILSGCGIRTSREGINAMIEHLKTKGGRRHLILQELPHEPESFIHLDMVFTLLDVNKCMVFKPVILNPQYKTIHFEIDENKEVKIHEEENLIVALRKLGMDLEPIFCGGDNEYAMAREQWHSGSNFFTFAPGKILGYERNYNTIENLGRHGFEILTAADVASGKVSVDDYKNCVVAFKGNELSRGGGGARCMTMPLHRDAVQW
ncbi:MAG: arginine deiminase [Bacteroidales bacterium]|nr:arginine deiminase [Bacteroidales bacterium]MBR5780718.1 arginine deiminase [Bacteroidales bacterium]